GAARLATVSVGRGRPTAAAPGSLSGITGEPLAGRRAACPVGAATEVALISPARAIEGLLRAATATEEAWGGRSAVTLPALTVTVADMVAALERAGGPEVTALIDWVPDPDVARLLTGWAAPIRALRAGRPGGTAGPRPGPGLRLHHRHVPGRVPGLMRSGCVPGPRDPRRYAGAGRGPGSGAWPE